MHANIYIRKANDRDVFAVSNVLAQSWKYAYRGIVPEDYLLSLQNDHWVQILKNGLNDDSIDCFVAENNEEIVGASIMRKSLEEYYPEDGEIVSFYLLPGFIGHGIGHQLYGFVETVLKQKGYAHCVLNVLSQNTRAIKFYQSHGFRIIQHATKVTLGGQDFTCHIMRKKL